MLDDQAHLSIQKGDGDDRKTIAWKFDRQSVRRALAYMLIVDELPFKFVEGKGFKHFLNATQPLFHTPSRITMARDCMKLFLEERRKLVFNLGEMSCFHRALGLSINMSKSKMMRIAVNEKKVEQAASRIRCDVLKYGSLSFEMENEDLIDRWKINPSQVGFRVDTDLSYVYFKVPMKVLQRNMALKHRYPRLYALELNKKVDVSLARSFRRVPRSGVKQSHLIDLLANIEGVSLVDMNDRWIWALEGSRDFYVALVRKLLDDKRLPVVSSQTRWIKAVSLSKKSIWVKWNNVLTSKEKGGLGVSNLYALNRALMFKWVWRFTTQKTLLWARVIKAIHGYDEKISNCSKSGHKSIWRDIVQKMDTFKKQEPSSHVFFGCHVAKDNFQKICRWWDVVFMEMSSCDEWVCLAKVTVAETGDRIVDGDGDGDYEKRLFL
nr:RNA-directed DNA polymerase, eukaryota, reverse transcriptase zinc-binding domain protein [Tanacetum cinerariifolium]